MAERPPFPFSTSSPRLKAPAASFFWFVGSRISRLLHPFQRLLGEAAFDLG